MRLFLRLAAVLHVGVFSVLFSAKLVAEELPETSESVRAEKLETKVIADAKNAQTDTVKGSSDTNAFLDWQREIITNQFLDLSDSLDRWVSRRDRKNKDENNSYMILSFDSVFEEGGEREFKAKLKAKVDLPNTKDRFKIIFESDPEEDSSPQDSEGSGKVGNEDLAENNAIAGIEYSLQKKEFEWQTAFDIGTRLSLPPDAFARLKLKKKTRFGDKWLSKTSFDLPWFAQDGAKPSMRQSFSYSLSEKWEFRNVLNVKYTAQESLRQSYVSFQLNQKWSDKLALEYKTGAYGDSDTPNEISAYFIQAGLKRNIVRDWIFLRIVPQVEYPREFDWRPQHAVTFTVQALYSN